MLRLLPFGFTQMAGDASWFNIILCNKGKCLRGFYAVFYGIGTKEPVRLCLSHVWRENAKEKRCQGAA